MAEKGTEAGTPQRRKKARAEGDMVRSRELLSAVAMMAGVIVVGIVSKQFVGTWQIVFEQSLNAAAVRQDGSELQWAGAIRRMLAPALLPLSMIMAASFAGALGVGIAQGGGLAIHPKVGWDEVLKAEPGDELQSALQPEGRDAGAEVVGPRRRSWWSSDGRRLKALMLPMPVMSTVRLPHAFAAAYGLALDASWVTLAWSALDYTVEWIAWNKRMKMTKQQMKDEIKEAMGNPQVKGRIRQVQNAMRRRKVKADISKASVVITNPTHYAVALEFSFETMSAPTVLAKGRDLHAAEIREEARWAGVPMIENPPLARSLYRAVEPGQSIPFELYAAVAGILAYLYRQKVEEKVREERMRAGT